MNQKTRPVWDFLRKHNRFARRSNSEFRTTSGLQPTLWVSRSRRYSGKQKPWTVSYFTPGGSSGLRLTFPEEASLLLGDVGVHHRVVLRLAAHQVVSRLHLAEARVLGHLMGGQRGPKLLLSSVPSHWLNGPLYTQ